MPKLPARIPIFTLLTTLLFTACSEEAVGGIIAGSVLFYFIGGLILFLLVIFALVDLYKKPYSMGKKVVWVLIILIIPYIGAALYFLIGRNA